VGKGFKQVEFFDGKRRSGRRIYGYNPHEFPSSGKRNAIPDIRCLQKAAQRFGKKLPSRAFHVYGLLLPTHSFHQHSRFVIGGLTACLPCRKSSRGGKDRPAQVFVNQPDAHGGRQESFGKGFGHGGAQVPGVGHGTRSMREIGPYLSVIVKRPPEMAVNVPSKFIAYMLREKQGGCTQQSQKNNESTLKERFAEAEINCQFDGYPQHQQVEPACQEGERVVQEILRDVDTGLAQAIAERRHYEQYIC